MNNAELFNEIQKQANKIADKWLNANSNKSGTVADIIEKIREANNFMQHERADLDEKLQQLNKTYRSNILAEPRRKAIASFNESLEAIRASVRVEINDFIEKKDEDISKMITTPPTEARLRLLQTMALRDGVSKIELMRHVPEAQGNFQELMTLQSIARKNGYRLHLPGQMDISELSHGLVLLKELLMRVCNQIGNSKNGMSAEGRMFFFPDECAHPETPYFVRLFDTIPALSAVEVTEENVLSPSEKTMLDMLFKDVDEKSPEDVNTIKKTLRIMNQHPSYIPLAKMSEKYAPYVEYAESVREKMDEDH